jgi:hypothetical protein
MGLTADQFSSTNENYNVTFEVTDGELEITEAEMALTVEDYTGVYDGAAHGVTVTPSVSEAQHCPTVQTMERPGARPHRRTQT